MRGGTDNSNKSRYIGDIALYPSPSVHGSWYFMSLLTGKKIHRNSWTTLPATEDVVKRVNDIAIQQGQPLVDSNFKYDFGTHFNFEGDASPIVHSEEDDNAVNELLPNESVVDENRAMNVDISEVQTVNDFEDEADTEEVLPAIDAVEEEIDVDEVLPVGQNLEIIHQENDVSEDEGANFIANDNDNADDEVDDDPEPPNDEQTDNS